MKYNFECLEPNRKEKFINLDKKFQSELEYIDILYIISNCIENYRKKYKLTQKQLSSELKISQEMVSKLESGKCNISVKKLVEIWNQLSNEEYDFAEELLYRISAKAKENYTRIYRTSYYSTFIVFQRKESENAAIKYNVYNKMVLTK